MENYIGMAAVIAAIVFSKSGRAIPVVVTIYYMLCISADRYFWGMDGSIFEVVTTTTSKAAAFQVVMVAIDAIIVVAILAFCRHSKIALFYACIVGMSAIYNTLGLFFSALSMDWYSHVYLLHQQYAIQLDVAVAWLASDNAVSRKFNRAFGYDAGKQDHEHGKPY